MLRLLVRWTRDAQFSCDQPKSCAFCLYYSPLRCISLRRLSSLLIFWVPLLLSLIFSLLYFSSIRTTCTFQKQNYTSPLHTILTFFSLRFEVGPLKIISSSSVTQAIAALGLMVLSMLSLLAACVYRIVDHKFQQAWNYVGSLGWLGLLFHMSLVILSVSVLCLKQYKNMKHDYQRTHVRSVSILSLCPLFPPIFSIYYSSFQFIAHLHISWLPWFSHSCYWRL